MSKQSFNYIKHKASFDFMTAKSPSKIRRNQKAINSSKFRHILIPLALISLLLSIIYVQKKEKHTDLLVQPVTKTLIYETSKQVQQEERYLIYLPHSGFGNQISEFENAALIAYLLNRTLIVPPIYLGFSENPFMSFELMKSNIRLIESLFAGVEVSKDQISINAYHRCVQLSPKSKNRAVVPFGLLYNMTKLPSWVKHVDIAEFIRRDELRAGCDVSSFKELYQYGFRYAQSMQGADLNFIVDNKRNDLVANTTERRFKTKKLHRYFEISGKHSEIKTYDTVQPLNSTSNGSVTYRTPLELYSHVVNLEAAKEKLRKLVVLGSSFGSTRIYFSDDYMQARRLELKGALIYENDIFEQITDTIVHQIGVNGFIGLHVRGGDGSFSMNIDETIDKMAGLLRKRSCNNRRPPCVSFPTSLYIASDVNPLKLRDAWKPLEELSVQIYTLGDFEKLLEPLKSLSKKAIRDGGNTMSQLMDAIDKTCGEVSSEYPRFSCPGFGYGDTLSSSIWYAFIDQMVAARGNAFIGTKGSTFSGLIERLHKDYRGQSAFVLGKV